MASRPALVQIAISMAKILDGPQASNAKPAAAKVLGAVLDKLHSAPVRGRGKLAVVRAMSTGGDTAGA
ncbi:MAG TPA: hypothetical protein VN255_10335 [Mycobacterium sp.]|nr:hypothetical protein [Mycobacterium sp.]